MHPNKFFVALLMATLILTSCLTRFDPEIGTQDAVKFVISGQVNKGDKVQHVSISTTSTVSEPRFFPVTGCVVTIVDDKGNLYSAVDGQDGNYDAVIPENELHAGASFKVDIEISDGTHIVSDFDQIHECPAVDTVYYEPKDVQTKYPAIMAKGLQFYTNLNAESVTSRNFMWEVIETYEYHSTYPIEYYYSYGTVHHVEPPDYSRKICWKTGIAKNFYTLTTKDLSQNKYNHFPFHFVDNYSSPRLVYGYSLLVRQFALSNNAFTYFEKIQNNSNEQGGLYERQPLIVEGNLHNLTNPEKKVLGFFRVAEVKSKRIFVSHVENMPLQYDPGCEPGEPRRSGLNGLAILTPPVYLYTSGNGFQLRLLEPECVDCLLVGGTNIKPSFWPY